MRNDCSTTSLPVSEASSFAIPASRSERSPASFIRAALRVISRAASTWVAMSASLNWIAWWWAIGLAEVLGARLAEGLALLPVAERQLEGALGDADTARRDIDAADLERVHHLDEAL